MKIKRIANIAATFCIISVLFYIGIMVYNILFDMLYGHGYPYRYILILLMSIFAITVSVFALRTAVKTRGFVLVLILEAIYLVFLILSYENIAHPNTTLFFCMFGQHAPTSIISASFQIMTFIPCILSIIFEAIACRLARKHIKDNDTSSEHYEGAICTKIKRIAIIAAAFCILSELFYIGIMGLTVCFGVEIWLKFPQEGYNYFFSEQFLFVLITSVYTIIALVYVIRAGIDTRRLPRALIIEAFYLVVLILSFYTIAYTSDNLSGRLDGGDVVPVGPTYFFLIMIFVPCIISMIFEVWAYILRRKQMKITDSV